MQDHQNMPIHKGTKDVLVKTLKIASIALVLAPFPKTLLAEEVSNATSLETLTVEGNALYDAASSEELTGYNTEAATVGTKTPAALKDIPQSITVLTNDYIEDRGFVHLDDAAKTTPGIRTLSNDTGRSSIFSRGYEYDEVLIDGLASPVSSVAGTLPSLSAFDRIEIMRGPSGLFSSTSELGGIINLVRKRATEDPQASINVGAGSWGRYQLGADVSGALVDDGSVRGRLVISQADSTSQVDESENLDQSVYATIEFDLDDKTELSLGLLHQTKSMVPNNGLASYDDGTLLDVDTSTFFGADWNDFNFEGTDIFADLTRQFSNGGRGRIAARASDRASDFDYAYSGDSVDATTDTFEKMSRYTNDIEEQSFAFDTNYSQPFEFMGNVSEFVVGFDHKQEENEASGSVGSATGTWSIYDFDSSSISKSLFTTTRTTSNDTSEQEQAIYGKLTLRPIKNLAVISGARLSTYKIDSSDDSGSGSHFTPYAGTVYDLTESQALYASYSEVFKPQTNADENGEFIDPREGQQFEFGIKGTYHNGLLNSRFTVFQLTDKNRAELDDTETYYETTGEYRVRGFEAEVSGQINSWDMLLGYTYMDTEVLEGSTSRYFSLMPEHMLTAWSKYSFGERSSVLNNMTIGAGMTAMSEFETSDGSVSTSGYAVFDTSITKQLNENLKVSLNINNLFDRKYYARVGATSTFNFYGESRNFMVSANYTF